MRVPFSYLDRQFADIEPYLDDLRAFVKTGDFTLGAPLKEFEKAFSSMWGASHGIGVGSGTDAIALALKGLGVGPGDEVITTPMTFIATVGAIAMTGAKPVFVDSEEGFVIDPEKIEPAITERTRAILPVHYTGNLADMPAIAKIAKAHGLVVVEDACQAIGGKIDGQTIGTWSEAACYSFHPLKNLNVWGDAGMITTSNSSFADQLRLLQNHGLQNRDEVAVFGVNSRFDTLQAVIGNRLIGQTAWITSRRQQIAKLYDEAFQDLEHVRVPTRRPGVEHVFHLYMLRCSDRQGMLDYLHGKGIEAKVHYPVPVHLQVAAGYLGYSKGDFPKCEKDCDEVITLPSHQHLSDEEVEYTIEALQQYKPELALS